MIEQIVEYNKKFVENKGYEPYLTSKYPNKKLAVLTCMDTRLTELLPAALGLKNGDAKIIKNAGGVITHPYGSVRKRNKEKERSSQQGGAVRSFMEEE